MLPIVRTRTLVSLLLRPSAAKTTVSRMDRDEPAQKEGNGRWNVLRVVGIIISALSLAGVVLWASSQDAPALPSSATQLGALGGAMLLYGGVSALRAERWRALLRTEGGDPSRADAYALTAVGFMGNNVLPARAGDAMRTYLMAPRSALSALEVIGTLIAERLLDVAVVLALFAFLAYGLLRGIDTPVSVGAESWVAVAVAALGLIVAVALLARRSQRLRTLLAKARPLATPTERLQSRAGLAMLALTFGIWVAEATSYMAVGHAVDISLSLTEALYVIAVAGVFLLIPSGPGYAGTLDAAVIFGMEAIGEGGGDAVSFLIMLRFVLFVPITLAGLVLIVARYGGWRGRA